MTASVDETEKLDVPEPARETTSPCSSQSKSSAEEVIICLQDAEKPKSSQSETYLTLTGTIKRGKKAGTATDVEVVIKRGDLEKIEPLVLSSSNDTSKKTCQCNTQYGLHILIWSFVCAPGVFTIASVYAFYLGTLTWYNILTLFTDEKKFIWRITVSPMLIIVYPLYIILCSVGIGLYASLVQISFDWKSWLKEVSDWEKGFYGWLCTALNLEDCSPYEEVILTEIRPPASSS